MIRKQAWAGVFIVLIAPPGEAIAQDVPDLAVEKYELANGLDVVLYRDDAMPKVSVNVLYDVGSKNERPGRTGFAHLFEHMMFQGSQHFDAEYFEALLPIGALVNGGTTSDWTMYWQEVPSEYLERTLWLEADRMGFLLPALTQEKLDNQRDVVKNERRQNYENTPYAKSSLLLDEMLYPSDHPYSWPTIGSQADLSAATVDDVSEFFRRYYTPNNASLVIAGSFEPDQAKELVEKYFGTISPGPPIDRLERWIPRLETPKRLLAEDTIDLSRLYVAWHSPPHYDAGDAEADLLASILTEGKTSRLYKSLVYDRQIAQDVSAGQVSKSLGSTFEVAVTAREGHSLAEIEAVLDEELERLRLYGITPDELELAQASWEARFIRRLEQIAGFYGIAGSLNFYNVFLGEPNSFAWDIERYRDATVESVNQLLWEFLAPERRAVLRLVPFGALEGAAADPDRSAMPGPGTARAFVPPVIQRSSLANGLEILVVEDRELPLVQANLVIRSGWTADDMSQPGAATLVAEMLDEGTESRSALEVSDTARSLAANLSTGSQFDGSFVRLNVLRQNLEPGLELLSDVALGPTFTEKEIERQKENLVNEMLAAESDPAARSRRALMDALFGVQHPYGRLMWRPVRGGATYYGMGDRESVTALRREDLIEFYDQHYRPNNATMIFAGDVDLPTAQRLTEQYFGRWQRGAVSEQPEWEPRQLDSTRLILVDKPGAPQSMIVAGSPGMRLGDQDFAAMQAVQHVLGGGFQRLDVNLREDKGYTYGTGFSMWGDHSRGPMYVIAPVQTQSTKESLVEILRELRGISGGRPIDREELEGAKAALIQRYPSAFDGVGPIAAQLEVVALERLGDDAWTDELERWRNLELEQVNAAARERIRPEAQVFVIVGDRGKIEAGLRELDLGDLEILTVN